MGLAAYRRKRKFKQTPEPAGKKGRAGRALTFVVQEHHARRLHWDFRLELDGVLKSWAVPKGPPASPAERRLAVMVEDHPLEYGQFEGVIPPGNYGAGHVSIWDRGTYHAAGAISRAESEPILREGLAKGRLSIVLEGERLRGEFALVRTNRGEENQWLLLPKQGGEIAPARKSRPAKARRTRKINIPGAPAGPMPHNIRPMLATLADRSFDRDGWLFEIKWDGYRAIAEVQDSHARLYSRTGLAFEARFVPVVESLRTLGHDAVLDGEVVVLDAEGRSQFQLLQNYQNTGRGRLIYVVFDLLYLDGRDLRRLPLRKRKEVLAKIVYRQPGILLSEHVEAKGAAFFEAASARGLEGVIAKDGDGPYRDGLRSRDWLKIKTRRRQEAVIGGFTEPRGSRNDLGALTLGVYEGNDLVYIGHTGGGFDTQSRADMRARLERLEQDECPFVKKPAANAPVHWVEPRLVCEVAFAEWTGDGLMRQPIFVGLREDKPARSVHREIAKPVPEKESSEPTNGQPAPTLSNLTKVYWPGEGITKGDLIDYYRTVAPLMLPHLRDRAQSLHRHPNGIDGPSFFQKDVSDHPPPSWVRTAVIESDSGSATQDIVCQDEPTLLYIANLGCIEINAWNSRIGKLDRPDYAIIDLDPQDLPFDRVVEAAQAVRRLLDRAGAESFCKTSGKRGLHVYVPLGARYTNDQARRFAELVANLVHARLPETTSVLRSPALRRGRIYLDFLQNRRGQTMAMPYSVRPVPGAWVSTPLKWSEVRRGLHAGKFTMGAVPRRLDRLGDLWKPVLGRGVDLMKIVEQLAK